MSLCYVRALRARSPGEREGLPRLRWWKLPACWIRGHRWRTRGGCFAIDGYSLQFCQCCDEEVAGRTAWSQIEPRSDDDELPWNWDDDDDGER